MNKLTSQFVTEQQIVERNQYDPVGQANDADEENPCDHAAHNVTDTDIAPVDFGCVSRSARGINAATIAAAR